MVLEFHEFEFHQKILNILKVIFQRTRVYDTRVTRQTRVSQIRIKKKVLNPYIFP